MNVVCLRCMVTVPVAGLVVNGFTGVAHCPRCGTPLGPLEEVKKNLAVAEAAAAERRAAATDEKYDIVLNAWPEGEAGLLLADLQASGDVMVVRLQETPKIGIMLIGGGGDLQKWLNRGQ